MMNENLKLLLKTVEDPTPGLLFDEHEHAKQPMRAYCSGHEAGLPSCPKELLVLEDLCGSKPNGLDALVELYSLHNGLKLYLTPGNVMEEKPYAVELYPLDQWDKHTAMWTSEEMAWAMEDCPLYDCGVWKVIGGFSSEGMSIVMFFSGEYEGVAQTGRCYCLGLDGILGYEEELAESFEKLAIELSAHAIVETLDRVGYTGFIQTKVVDGIPSGYGDVVVEYIRDVTDNPFLVE